LYWNTMTVQKTLAIKNYFKSSDVARSNLLRCSDAK
jgi:hypothetical protein